MATAEADIGKQESGLFTELGASGLKRFGGIVREEFLPKLQGTRAVKVFREMADNDPVVGAILFAIDMLIRKVEWRVEPGGRSRQDEEAAAFLSGALDDMSNSWEDTVSEILSFLTFGWAYHEIVYKRREGDSREPGRRSKFTDGRIGWRKLPIRAQETLLEWEFDEEGGVQAMLQLPPPDFDRKRIPIEKALLFRTSVHKGNPEGKALDPNTPIPTPDGWRTLDEIGPGDKVFDEQGRIRYVLARRDWEDRPCYRITFGDGTEIIADAEHEWATQKLWERSKGRSAKIRTTREIADSVKNSNGVSNHSVPWAAPLDFPEQLLALEPYFLGLWLGDGTSRAAKISCHAQDLEETVGLIEGCGYETGVTPNGDPEGNGRAISVYGDGRWDQQGPQATLRALGVLENKHIPEPYLRSSIDQRRALLAGLMDSDGYVDVYGRCEFTNTNEALAAGVAELVRSLGVGVSTSARINSAGNTSWYVKFTPPWSPFRLARKAARTLNERARTNHYITAAEPVSRRRTVCIEVDGPSHLFLAGEALVPTHNSCLRNAYIPWYFKREMERIEAIGIERDLAGLPKATAPPEWFGPTAKPEEKAALEELKRIVRDIRRDEQEGVAIPAIYDSEGNRLLDIELMSTGGRRQLDIEATIERYDRRIAMTVLADFILLGHDAVGSFALASSKTDIFTAAISAWVGSIAGIFNRHAIPRLFDLNGFRLEALPELVPGDVETVDLEALAEYITALAGAGAPLFPDEDLERHLREQAGLPSPAEEDV